MKKVSEDSEVYIFEEKENETISELKRENEKLKLQVQQLQAESIKFKDSVMEYMMYGISGGEKYSRNDNIQFRCRSVFKNMILSLTKIFPSSFYKDSMSNLYRRCMAAGVYVLMYIHKDKSNKYYKKWQEVCRILDQLNTIGYEEEKNRLEREAIDISDRIIKSTMKNKHRLAETVDRKYQKINDIYVKDLNPES